MRHVLLLLLGVLFCTASLANTTLTYQGLLDQSDAPLNGEVLMRFQMFSEADGGAPVGPLLTRSVLVERGLMSVDLDFGSQAYESGLWLQIEVDGDILQPRQRIAAAPLAVRSLDSAGLQASIDALLQRVGALEAANAQLSGQVDSLVASSAQQATSINALQSELADADLEIVQLQAVAQSQGVSLNSLNARTTALEGKTAAITVSGDDLLVQGVNLHLRSGSGSTDGAPNGRGNLIIGYNEPGVPSERSGSHNLVLGIRNQYTSHSGIVGGVDNLVSAPYASVLSGELNQSTGLQSVIVSGYGGIADDTTSVVISGYQNQASGFRSVVVSGWQNDSNGSYSSILGGDANITTATESSIGGGSAITSTSTRKFSARGTIAP